LNHFRGGSTLIHIAHHQIQQQTAKTNKPTPCPYLTQKEKKLQETNLKHSNGSKHQSEKEKETNLEFVET